MPPPDEKKYLTDVVNASRRLRTPGLTTKEQKEAQASFDASCSSAEKGLGRSIKTYLKKIDELETSVAGNVDELVNVVLGGQSSGINDADVDALLAASTRELAQEEALARERANRKKFTRDHPPGPKRTIPGPVPDADFSFLNQSSVDDFDVFVKGLEADLDNELGDTDLSMADMLAVHESAITDAEDYIADLESHIEDQQIFIAETNIDNAILSAEELKAHIDEKRAMPVAQLDEVASMTLTDDALRALEKRAEADSDMRPVAKETLKLLDGPVKKSEATRGVGVSQERDPNKARPSSMATRNLSSSEPLSMGQRLLTLLNTISKAIGNWLKGNKAKKTAAARGASNADGSPMIEMKTFVKPLNERVMDLLKEAKKARATSLSCAGDAKKHAQIITSEKDRGRPNSPIAEQSRKRKKLFEKKAMVQKTRAIDYIKQAKALDPDLNIQDRVAAQRTPTRR